MPKQKAQKCLICGGALKPATTTLTLERNGVAVHFSDAPCLRCIQCGEEEFEGPLAVELGKVAEAFFQTGETIAALPAPIRHVRVDFSPELAPAAV
jgi:YgiT-type zinc finger domain-containing protein